MVLSGKKQVGLAIALACFLAGFSGALISAVEVTNYSKQYGREIVRYDVFYQGWDATIHAALYLQRDPTLRTRPAVVISHGLSGSNDVMKRYAVEFCHAGYVVLAPDLRGHGRSTGYCSMGVKESVDIMAGVNYLRTRVYPDFGITIDQTGVVGHSLGSIAVLKAAYLLGLNGSVVLGHPADITRLIQDKVDVDFADLIETFDIENEIDPEDYLENVSSVVYARDRLTNPDPRPYNLLILHGEDDTAVDASIPYQLFKYITGESSPAQNITYGTFSDRNATKFVNYTGHAHLDHSEEQFYPLMIEEAINWMNLALQTGFTPTSRSNFIPFDNVRAAWDMVQGFVFLCYAGIFIVPLVVLGREESKKKLPDFKKPEEENPKGSFKSSLILTGVLGAYLLVGVLIGLTFQSLSFLQIVSYLPLKPFIQIFLFLIPLNVLLLSWINRKTTGKVFPYEISRDQAKKEFGDSVVGVVAAGFFPFMIISFADQVGMLFFIKWIREPGYAILAMCVFWGFFFTTTLLFKTLLNNILPSSRWKPLLEIGCQALSLGLCFLLIFALLPIGQANLVMGDGGLPLYLLVGLGFGVLMQLLASLEYVLNWFLRSATFAPTFLSVLLVWILATVFPIF